MTNNTPPVCEIGLFEVSIDQMLSGSLKYIVAETQEGVRFTLHADATEATHWGIAKKIQVHESNVVGGGIVVYREGKLTLRGRSGKFGEELSTVRSAFIDCLNERFHAEIAAFNA